MTKNSKGKNFCQGNPDKAALSSAPLGKLCLMHNLGFIELIEACRRAKKKSNQIKIRLLPKQLKATVGRL